MCAYVCGMYVHVCMVDVCMYMCVLWVYSIHTYFLICFSILARKFDVAAQKLEANAEFNFFDGTGNALTH